MNSDNIQERVDPMIAALLKVKRGELGQEATIAALEGIKNAADCLIGDIECGVAQEYVNGC